MDTLSRLRAVPQEALTIVGGLFVMAVGNYMIIPFFALYLTGGVGLSVMQVGVILAVRLWMQRGFALFGGVLVDRLGARATMAAGLLLRALAYGGIAFSESFWVLLAWTAAIGLSGALYTPAGKTALARLAPPEARVMTFALRNLGINLGVALGPPVGLLAAAYSYKAAFILAAGLFLLLLVLTFAVVPRDAPSAGNTRVDLRELARMSAEPRVTQMAVVMAIFFAFYVQMELTMPLFAELQFSRAAAGLLFTANAAAVIALQLPLAPWIERTSLGSALSLGLMACGLRFLLIALSFGTTEFLTAVFVFTLGEIIIEPKVDSEVGRVVDPGRLGACFGLLNLAGSLGGVVGYYAGGVGFDRGHTWGNDRLLWIVLAALAFASAAAVFHKLQSLRTGRVIDVRHKGEIA